MDPEEIDARRFVVQLRALTEAAYERRDWLGWFLGSCALTGARINYRVSYGRWL
jgi:hypothetical protein